MPELLAGEPDQLHEKVPQAVNLNAFPTTFILGRDGRVRGVHAGFPGPGSGEFYRKAERDISTEVEQLLKERVELTPLIDKTAAAGARLQATLRVRLPTDVHVQSDKPNDPSLIATALTVTSPPGVTVNRIVYPSASNLAQAGRDKPLAVFGPEFVIQVQLTVDADAAPGEITVPAQLRYQACDERMCFPPSRASTSWVFTVTK